MDPLEAAKPRGEWRGDFDIPPARKPCVFEKPAHQCAGKTDWPREVHKSIKCQMTLRILPKGLFALLEKTISLLVALEGVDSEKFNDF